MSYKQECIIGKDALIAHYENLRRDEASMLPARTTNRFEFGKALFVRNGMMSWLHVVGSLGTMKPKRQEEQISADRICLEPEKDAVCLHGETVLVVSNMILSNLKEICL